MHIYPHHLNDAQPSIEHVHRRTQPMPCRDTILETKLIKIGSVVRPTIWVPKPRRKLQYEANLNLKRCLLKN